MTDGDALDVELLFDAEEVPIHVSTAEGLVATDSSLKNKGCVAHFGAGSLVSDDDADCPFVIRNDTDVSTGCSLASDGGSNDDVRIFDGNSDLLGDQS